MLTKGVIFIFLLANSVLSQQAVNNNTNVVTDNKNYTTSNIIPVVKDNASSTSSASSEPIPNEEIIPCVAGISTGFGLVRKPNITSKIQIGIPYNVSWDWTVTITKPPQYIDVYIQLMAPYVAEKWTTVVAKNIPSEPRWFMWTPEGLVDGKYKLRFVPDGKETFKVPANELPCFANGESVPFVTAAFSVSNSKGDLGVYDDPYAPSSSLRNHVSNSGVVVKLIPLLVTIMFFIV